MEKIRRRLRNKYPDTYVDNLDEALKFKDETLAQHKRISIGLLENAAKIYYELAKRKIVPDVLSDQTAATDLNIGYIPKEYEVPKA